jgi:hypothetical protein
VPPARRRFPDENAMHDDTARAAARDARALDPWAFPLPRREHDVRALMRDFETVAKAEAERDLRVRHLRRAGAGEHHRLAGKLEACAPGARCRSAACPICCRRLRIWLVGAALEVLAASDLAVATLIPGGQAVPANRPRDLSPRCLKDLLRQQLRRCGATAGGVVVGGVDGEHDAAHGLWQPHFHLVAPAALAPALDGVGDRYYPKSDRVYRPALVQPVNDRARQISYCAKAYWPQVPRYLDDAGKEHRAPPRRLDEPLHVEWLTWRDRFALADFIFLHGVRRHGGELRIAGPSAA